MPKKVNDRLLSSPMTLFEDKASEVVAAGVLLQSGAAGFLTNQLFYLMHPTFLTSIRKLFVNVKKQANSDENHPDIISVLKENGNLKAELDYVYSILQQPNCRYQLHVTPRHPPFLIRMRSRGNHMDIIVYVVEKRREVVKVFIHLVGEDMVIDDIEIDVSDYHKYIGSILLREMTTAAKALKLNQITGMFGSNEEIHFHFLAQLYSEMGFVVNRHVAKQKGDIVFHIANAQA